jgi:RNA recognition motif-containing protein
MPLKVTERDVYEFFSKAGKVSGLWFVFYIYNAKIVACFWIL